jgi:aminopeptidase YwaD
LFHPLLERVRREVSGERALESVHRLAGFHRVQSSPGYDEASSWVAEKLEAAGLIVEIEHVPGDGRTRFLGQLMPEGWACDRATATLVDGTRRERLCDYDADRLSLVLRSGPARGRYPLVDVRDGTEPDDYLGIDLRDRVVLAGGDVHRVHELAVVDRGAAGILTDTRRLLPSVREDHDETDALNYTSFWWLADEPHGWGFVVTPRVAAGLRERLARGAKLELDVDIESRTFATRIPLLSARLRGTSEGEVLVVSHLCHPRPSANDNASGAAANLETARTLAALRARRELGTLERSVRFLWVPELTGTHAFVAVDGARAARVATALNLDMVGEDQAKCGSTFLLERGPCFAGSFAEELLARIRERAVDWVTSYSGAGHYSLVRMAEIPYGGGSDHAVWVDPAIGVPCPMLIQWPDRFYHSSHDTPDKTDPASLVLAARCAATYAGFLATAAEPERAWLVDAVGRGARRHLLGALDDADSATAVEREALRGRQALSSLARLGVSAAVIATAQRDLEAFARRETRASDRDPAPQRPRSGSRRPRRRLGAPLGFPRRLTLGWDALPREERERWRRLELETPDAYRLGEVAWFACDGLRSLDEITHLVRLETGREDEGFVTAFFDFVARLGLADWITEEDSCNPSARDMAGR